MCVVGGGLRFSLFPLACVCSYCFVFLACLPGVHIVVYCISRRAAMAECSGLRPATRRNSVLPSVMLDGIPLSVGQRVFVLFCGAWLAGCVGYISSAAVRIDGEVDPSDACQVDIVDVPHRLRFRADGGIDAIREAPTHVMVIQDVSDALVSYHSLRNTAQRAAARTANEIKIAQPGWRVYTSFVLCKWIAQ